MNHLREVPLGLLKKIDCVWNKQIRTHALVLPVFGENYRVRGMIAFSSKESPLWYPGTPISTEKGRLTFKTEMMEHPPLLEGMENHIWKDAYFLDRGRWLMRFMPNRVLEADLAPKDLAPKDGVTGPINLEGGRLKGHRIIDIIFEPGLHRVRWIVVRAGWFRTRRLSVMSIPPLSESLEVARALPALLMPSDVGEIPRPSLSTPSRRLGWLGRSMRRVLQDIADQYPPPKD